MSNSKKGIILSTKDYEGFRNDMIEMLKQKLPEYSDFSESDAGIVILELLAYQLDILSYYNEKIGSENFLETAQERESVARLCRMLGYKLREATPSQFDQVFEIVPQLEETTIPEKTIIKTEGDDLEPIVTFETQEALVIPPNKTGLEKDEKGNYIYTVPVVQGYSIENEIVGTSNNSPNQLFILDYAPVIEESVHIIVDNGLGFEEWTRVENFIDSYSHSKHYTLTINDEGQAQIRFGNGVSGMIPNSIIDGIQASYRVGGGTEGNVGVGTITKMPSELAVIKRTFNPYPAKIQGRDRESLDEARVKAPALLGSKSGAVTLRDFKVIALSILGISRANATEGVRGTMLVNVYFYPDGSVSDEVLKQELIDIYDEKKVVGIIVNIEKGTERPIDVVADIKTYSKYKNSEVKDVVTNILKSIIYAGRYDFQEVPESSDIVMDLIENDVVKGVDIKLSNHTNLKPNEIITLGNVTVNVVGGKE